MTSFNASEIQNTNVAVKTAHEKTNLLEEMVQRHLYSRKKM